MRPCTQPMPPEWSGEDISNKSLLIFERGGGHVGGLLRCARFVCPASQKAKRTMVLVQPRLVPLFKRSFDIDVQSSEQNTEAVCECDMAAGFGTLSAMYGRDWSAIQRSFSPLRADPELTLAFRKQYESA